MNKENVIFCTPNGNDYIFSQSLSSIFYCHPEMTKLILRSKSKSKITTTKTESYYLKKLQFLKENGILNTCSENSLKASYIGAEEIKKQVANLKVLTFEVTEECNLNCKYCIYGNFYNVKTTRKRKKLDFIYVKNILDYLQALWCSDYNVSKDNVLFIGFYGGEPLLNVSLIKEVINYVKRMRLPNHQVKFSITTNGTLLKNYIDFLVEENVNILISLDGNEKNNSYRINQSRENSFRSIVRNVKLIREKYPIYYENNVQFNSVLHNRNSVEEIYKFFKNEFNKTPRIAQISTSGIEEQSTDEFWKTFVNINESLFQAEDYSRIEEEMFLKAPKPLDCAIFLDQYSGNSFTDYNFLIMPNRFFGKLPTGTCFPFNRKMFVNAVGKIYQCERIDSKYSLGNVTSSKVNINYRLIAKKINNYYDKMRSQCNNCYKLKNCVQCMYYLDQLDKKPICNGHMDQLKFGEYLSSTMAYFENNKALYKRIMQEVILR